MNQTSTLRIQYYNIDWGIVKNGQFDHINFIQTLSGFRCNENAKAFLKEDAKRSNDD